jgi:hypothetical protein
MKALPDDSEPPWPERFDRAALERIRSNISSKDWCSLYQQSPVIEEGGSARNGSSRSSGHTTRHRRS